MDKNTTKGASHKDAAWSHDLLSVTAPDSSNADRRCMTLSWVSQHRVNAMFAFGKCLRVNWHARRLMDPPLRTRVMHHVPNLMQVVPRVPHKLGPLERRGAGWREQAAGSGRRTRVIS